MMLTELAEIARRTGYPVREVEGWRTRGRPGGMIDVRTITCHHTANGGAPGNYPSLTVVRDGRGDLPGPLAQLGLGVDGTIYVIAAGKSNHAGVSKSPRFTNPYAIGIEAEARGTPGAVGDWPPRQMESYARLVRALIDHYRLPVTAVLGHKETAAPAGRKSDPSFPMRDFRGDVKRVDLSQPPKELNEMNDKDWERLEKLLDARVKAMVIHVLTREPIVLNRPTAAAKAADPKAVGSRGSVTWALGNIEGDQDDDRAIVAEVAADTSVLRPPVEGR
jgi:N-acetylmuramoyl-L-alanine amidase